MEQHINDGKLLRPHNLVIVRLVELLIKTTVKLRKIPIVVPGILYSVILTFPMIEILKPRCFGLIFSSYVLRAS